MRMIFSLTRLFAYWRAKSLGKKIAGMATSLDKVQTTFMKHIEENHKSINALVAENDGLREGAKAAGAMRDGLRTVTSAMSTPAGASAINATA